MIIGIDLGTSTTEAAVYRNGKVEMIPNSLGEIVTPSAIGLDENDQVIIGEPARSQYIIYPERTAIEVKRKFGTQKKIQLGNSEIREAYENLKDGEQTDAVGMEMPDDIFADRMLQQIKKYMQEHQFWLAAETAGEALRIFGESECFIYYEALNQRIAGQTGKSVKGFEKLVEKYPDKCMYRTQLAFSYQERGYGKKAYAAFGKAYERGERDLDFIKLYAICCEERGYLEQAVSLLTELVTRGMKNPAKNLEEMLDAFAGIGMMYLRLDENLEKILEVFLEFLKMTLSFVCDYKDVYIQVMGLLYMSADHKSFGTAQLLNEIHDEMKHILGDSFEKIWFTYAETSEATQMLSDPQIPDYFGSITETWEYEDEGLI